MGRVGTWVASALTKPMVAAAAQRTTPAASHDDLRWMHWLDAPNRQGGGKDAAQGGTDSATSDSQQVAPKTLTNTGAMTTGRLGTRLGYLNHLQYQTQLGLCGLRGVSLAIQKARSMGSRT